MENKKTVLIIDDEVDFSETMRFYLESVNFRVIVANTPEDGLEKAHLLPDIILLDLRMPRMSGHEVCRRLKEDNVTLAIPIIMLTCNNQTLDKVEAFNLGVSDYIGKEAPFEEILARMKAALRLSSTAVTAQAQQERNKRILDLRNIIDAKKIRILYQPIVAISTGEPIGYEALTRGPQGSPLESPIELFSLASEENMYFELDRICLAQAAKNAVFVSGSKLLFLNIDPTVLEKDYFKNLEILEDSPLTPAQICIEITERTCIKNFAKFCAELDHFRSQGIKIAIDDVGEGYSSLKAIAELKPEFIKVDMGIVRNVNADKVKTSLVQIISDLTKKLGCHLVAEGIETEEERRALIKLEVEFGQGYLFAKPSENPSVIKTFNPQR